MYNKENINFFRLRSTQDSLNRIFRLALMAKPQLLAFEKGARLLSNGGHIENSDFFEFTFLEISQLR